MNNINGNLASIDLLNGSIIPTSSSEMRSRNDQEIQRSINLAISDEEEFQLSLGKANVDMEIGYSQDTYQLLLDSAQNHTDRISPSIQMVPSRIRDLNPRVFNPRQVSIGPLHRKNVNLHAFERQKGIFMHDLLDNSGLPLEQTLKTCVEKVNDSMDKIKDCYGDGIKGYSDDEITRMMVMDGCFILEFIYKWYIELFDENMVIEPMSIALDLVLVENQIPFFVLQDIFEFTCSRFEPAAITSLYQLMDVFVQYLIFFQRESVMKNIGVHTTHDHILGFFHDCYAPLEDVKKNQSSDSDSGKDVEINGSPDHSQKDVEINLSSDSEKDVLPSDSDKDVEIIESPDFQSFYSAVELDRSGLNFKPHHQSQGQQWAFGIELELPCFSGCRPWARPTLRMPVLRILSYTELAFRNLMAYEELCPRWVIRYITSYVIAMDILIDNHEDVALLVKSKVLVNTIGSNEEAANLINNMRKDIYSDLLYEKVWEEMNRYHDRFWPRNIAWLRRTYFSNPWNIIALFAGIFLFVFTVVQTYYTVNPV